MADTPSVFHPLARPRPFVDLFVDKAAFRHVVDGITKTIRASFDPSHPATMKTPTRDEIKRRFAICEKWFRDLRGTRGWTVDRCLAKLPQALRAEILGEKFEPDNRMLWVPSDGAQ